jgi:hypothetical protein
MARQLLLSLCAPTLHRLCLPAARMETAAQLEQARGQSFETAADWTRATALAAATAVMLICPTALARLLA